MKLKFLLSIMLLFFGGTILFSQNTQDMVPVSSRVYEYLQVLAAQQNKVTIIIERPASRQKILGELDKLEYDQLSSSAQALYQQVLQELKPSPLYTEAGGLAIDVGMEMNLEGYAEADSEHVRFAVPDTGRRALLKIPLEAWLFDSFYGKFEMPVKKEPFLYERVPDHGGNWINLPVTMSQIDYQFPYVAYLNAGGEHWNLQIGRDVLRYGSGHGGNFLIGDHIPYYSFVRAETFWEGFTFYYSAIDLEPWDTINPSASGAGDSEFVHKVLFSHGFVFSFIPRLRLSLRESSLLSEFDPSLNYLNPLMMFHNWYLDSSNSIMTVDAKWNVYKGVNLYSVLAIDQLQTFFELQRYDNAATTPNAYGYMLGSEVSVVRERGYWLGNIEWVYTNPWLYIHENANANLLWTGQIRSNVDGTYFKQLPLGYPDGPDSMNLQGRVSYTRPDRFCASGGYSFTVQGEQTVVTPWEKSEAAASLRTPTGTAEFTHTAWTQFAWYPYGLPLLSEIGTGLSYVYVLNENHTDGADYHDLQLTLHVALEL